MASRAAVRSACAALMLLIAATAIAAHTELQWSRPAAGEVLVGSPAELRLRFTSPVEPSYTSAMLVGPDGLEVPLPPLEVAEGRREYFAPLAEPLAPGVYTLRWRTTAADGHVIQGEFGFEVEPDPAAPEPPVAPPPAEVAPPPATATPTFPAWADVGSPLAAVVRFLHFTALLLLVGVTAFRFGVLPRLVNGGAVAAAAGARALATGTLAVLGVVILARLVLQSVALHGLELAWEPASLRRMLTGTVWGVAWLLQLAAAALVLIGLMLDFRRASTRGGWAVMALGVLGLAMVPALSGHAVVVERIGWVAVINDTVHVLGAGTWLGTLAVVLFVAVPAALRAGDQRLAAVATLVNRFSRVALVAVAVVVSTGVINALFHFGAVSELWTTAYGRTLLLKVGVLLPVIGLGFYNWRVVRPSLGGEAATRRLRRSAGAEIGVGVLVVLVTAALVAVPRP